MIGADKLNAQQERVNLWRFEIARQFDSWKGLKSIGETHSEERKCTRDGRYVAGKGV